MYKGSERAPGAGASVTTVTERAQFACCYDAGPVTSLSRPPYAGQMIGPGPTGSNRRPPAP